MAVFLGACLGLQADDKKVSVDASVNTDRPAAQVDLNRNDRDAADRANDNGKLSRGDASFVKEAAQAGLMEVKMGQIAKDRATSPEIKRFGEMLVKDHGKANEKLNALAAGKGVNLAKDMEMKHGKMLRDLEAKSGADFDKNFAEHAVKHHRSDVSKFEKASRDLNDTELRAFATDTLPTLRAHLDEAQRIARSMGVNVAVSDASEYGHENHLRAEGDVNRAGAGRVDVDVDRDRNASAETRVEVDTGKNDGRTLGVETRAGDDKTLGVETRKSDDRVLGIQTGPGDGKTLGVNTRKDDGKILGIVPAPGARADADVDVDVDRNDGIEVKADADIDRDSKGGIRSDIDTGRDASAETKVEVDTDKGDGKTLGVNTQAGDDRTLGVETRKGDGRILGIQTGPGDGKTLGINTSKDDGKILGIVRAPGRNKAESTIDVDVDRSSDSVEVKADADVDVDHDRSVGAAATTEKGASAKVESRVDIDRDAKVMTYNELPKKVQATVRTQNGSENIKSAKRHMMNGKAAYKVEIQKEGRNQILHIAEDGTIIKDNNK